MAVSDFIGRSSTSRTDVNAARAGATDFGKRMIHSSRLIHCMGIVLWKCSQHGCEYKKLIYTAKTFFKFASRLDECIINLGDCVNFFFFFFGGGGDNWVKIIALMPSYLISMACGIGIIRTASKLDIEVRPPDVQIFAVLTNWSHRKLEHPFTD
jgi:hypothetical protein